MESLVEKRKAESEKRNPGERGESAPCWSETLSTFSRRNVLKSLAGLGVSLMLPGLDLLAANKRGKERQKSFILLWLAGGPSQLETWDPHPGTKIGGPTKAIDTKLPGLQIAHLYPRMAEQIDSLSVIRSLVSKEGDHERGTYFLKTGFRPAPALTHPSVGAILTHELPADDIEIPQHVSLLNTQWPARGGFLGAKYDAFKVFDPGRSLQNLKSSTTDKARRKRRLSNLDVISKSFQQKRQLQVDRTLHQQTIERALTMMSSDQLKALDLKNEPKPKLDAYGDTQFGRGCLVARRLIETGVRAVEVTLNGFDSHASNFGSHEESAKSLDPAFAALIADLKERDLLDSTVVLCIGEFGRTPKINPLDGRDHWPSGFSCLIGGGGIKSGLVIGETDPTGKETKPVDPIDVNQLYATIFKTMGVDYAQEVITPIGRPMQLCDGEPIKRLLG